jgi:hypothetical protein
MASSLETAMPTRAPIGQTSLATPSGSAPAVARRGDADLKSALEHLRSVFPGGGKRGFAEDAV